MTDLIKLQSINIYQHKIVPFYRTRAILSHSFSHSIFTISHILSRSLIFLISKKWKTNFFKILRYFFHFIKINRFQIYIDQTSNLASISTFMLQQFSIKSPKWYTKIKQREQLSGIKLKCWLNGNERQPAIRQNWW